MAPSKYCGPFAATKFIDTAYSKNSRKALSINLNYNQGSNTNTSDPVYMQKLQDASIWTHQVTFPGGIYESVFGRFFGSYLIAYFMALLVVFIFINYNREMSLTAMSQKKAVSDQNSMVSSRNRKSAKKHKLKAQNSAERRIQI